MKEQNKNSKKKVVVSAVSVIMAAALLLGGTYAWQSISQVALNEKSETINPGGRLHDDFNGTNKDIYVENFADEKIFARVRLDEYFEITTNEGTAAETTKIVTSTATKGDTSTYVTHKFGEENVTDNYWKWTTGGSTTYMPTFNKNKDSLDADINGTYAQNYEDYVDYSVVTEKTDYAVYDADDNKDEDEGIKSVEETHYSRTSCDATLMSMQEWIDSGSTPGDYWVYDTDGWVYWASAISPNSATGLLLDKIQLTKVMDDSYYYAISVIAQFITADDLGQDNGTGFYDTSAGTVPSEDAEKLLRAIGVDMGEEPLPTGDTIYSLYANNEDGYYDLIMFSSAYNITKAQAAAIAGVDEADVYDWFKKEPDYSSSAMMHNYNVSSVKFANEVKPTDMSNYFECVGQDVDDATFDFTNLDTSNVTNMANMFNGCGVNTIDVSSFDTSNVTQMKYMFSNMGTAFSNTSLILGEHFDTSKVTDMSYMFFGSRYLNQVDLSTFDTSNVKNMKSMFCDCGLTSIDLSNFDVSNVENMSIMFDSCRNLTELDLSTFNTSKVADMSYMFSGCSSLQTLTLGENWSTSNVTNMTDMFSQCYELILDCSNWDVSKVTAHSNFAEDLDNITEPSWVS